MSLGKMMRITSCDTCPIEDCAFKNSTEAGQINENCLLETPSKSIEAKLGSTVVRSRDELAAARSNEYVNSLDYKETWLT